MKIDFGGSMRIFLLEALEGIAQEGEHCYAKVAGAFKAAVYRDEELAQAIENAMRGTPQNTKGKQEVG